MDRSAIGEIRKTLVYKQGDMSVGQFAGCFINAKKEIKGTFSERLLSKDEVVIHKFLDIYKKTLANNDSDIKFDPKDREDGGFQFLAEKIRATELKNESINGILIDKIKDCLPDNNYVITLMHGSYDVPEKTSDKRKVDDASSTLYRYIICSVCPVKTQKGTLGYLTEKEEIGENPQQLIVDKPVFGFLYPSFNDRAADTGSLLCFRTEKLDISEELFAHKAPDLVKPERKSAKRTLQEAPEDAGEGIRVAMGTTSGLSQYTSSTGHIPSLDTGSLNNDAHYVRENLIEDDMPSPKSHSNEPADSEIIASQGRTFKNESREGTPAPRKRRPVRITGDESLIEKKIIDGRVYYMIAAQDCEISAQ